MKRDVLTGIFRRRRLRRDFYLFALVKNEKAFLARMEFWSIVPHHVVTVRKSNFGSLSFMSTLVHLINLDLADAPDGVMFTNRTHDCGLGEPGGFGGNNVGRYPYAGYASRQNDVGAGKPGLDVSSGQVLHWITARHRHCRGHLPNVMLIDRLDRNTLPKHQSVRIKDGLLSFLKFLPPSQQNRDVLAGVVTERLRRMNHFIYPDNDRSIVYWNSTHSGGLKLLHCPFEDESRFLSESIRA